MVKVQQQVICGAGTESCFIEQFFSSVILMPLAIRCVYTVSLCVLRQLACGVLQSWKKVAVGLLVQEGLFWSPPSCENLLGEPEYVGLVWQHVLLLLKSLSS